MSELFFGGGHARYHGFSGSLNFIVVDGLLVAEVNNSLTGICVDLIVMGEHLLEVSIRFVDFIPVFSKRHYKIYRHLVINEI